MERSKETEYELKAFLLEATGKAGAEHFSVEAEGINALIQKKFVDYGSMSDFIKIIKSIYVNLKLTQ